MFPDLSKNLLVTFFQDEFKNSRDNTLRLSLLHDDVRKETLIYDRLELLFDDDYFSRLANRYQDYLKDKEYTDRDYIFSDIHDFQTTLESFSSASFKVNPTPDSEKLKDFQARFPFTIYSITCVNSQNVPSFVDCILQNYSDDDYVTLPSWLLYVAEHLEFQI